MHFWILALLSSALFGASTPVGKILLRDLSATQLAGLLYLGAALGVAIPLLRARHGLFGARLTGPNVRRLAGSIFFGGILGPIFLLAGLRLAASASVSLWLNLELVATVLLGRFFFRDQLGNWGAMGAVLITLASAILSVGEGSATWQAGGLLALACLCWGMDNHLTALIDGILPAQSTFWKGLTAGTTNLLLGLILSDFGAGPTVLGAALVTGALAYGVSIVLYITAAQGLGAVRSQMVFAAAPFFGLGISALVLGEALSWRHGAAAALQLLGIVFLFRDRHDHVHEHADMAHTHLHSHDDGHHDHVHPGMPSRTRHTHFHSHGAIRHAHPHWPDLHHRHRH